MARCWVMTWLGMAAAGGWATGARVALFGWLGAKAPVWCAFVDDGLQVLVAEFVVHEVRVFDIAYAVGAKAANLGAAAELAGALEAVGEAGQVPFVRLGAGRGYGVVAGSGGSWAARLGPGLAGAGRSRAGPAGGAIGLPISRAGGWLPCPWRGPAAWVLAGRPPYKLPHTEQ